MPVLMTFILIATASLCGQNPVAARGSGVRRALDPKRWWTGGTILGTNSSHRWRSDFPEDKYDFKVQKDQRTFALNLLHAAALDFVSGYAGISGSNIGPDFGDGDNSYTRRFQDQAPTW